LEFTEWVKPTSLHTVGGASNSLGAWPNEEH